VVQGIAFSARQRWHIRPVCAMLPRAMNKSLLLASALCVFAACKGNTYRVNVGPMFAIANGDVALQNGAGGLSLGANQNDVDSAIGAGDTQAAPYARLEVNNDKHRFRAHGFGLDSNSTGTVLGAYGDIPAGTSVTTSLEFYAIAANWSYQLLRSQVYRVGAGCPARLLLARRRGAQQRGSRRGSSPTCWCRCRSSRWKATWAR
jgi:hypothetical protein